MLKCKCLSSGLRWIWVSGIVVLIDQITKKLAQKNLIEYSSVSVMPSFDLTLSYNRGSAFSFLNSASGWQVWLFGVIAVAVSIGILIWLKKLSASQRWVGIALALILGGALGNLYDRLSYGYVIDFIDLYISTLHWPVFNVADTAICIGAAMLLWDAVKKR